MSRDENLACDGPFDTAPVIGARGRKERRPVDLTMYPTAALYALLAIVTAGFGVGVLVYQTGATQRTLTRRRGNLVGGVLLIMVGGIVLLTQIWAIVSGSYAHLG